MTDSHPLWGREITRRKFITAFASLTAIAAGAASGIVRLPRLDELLTAGPDGRQEVWLTLGSLSQLAPGIPAGFPFNRKVRDGWIESVQTGIAYAVTHDRHDVQVFANICTHGGCRITWRPERQAFVCPCHAGAFDIDGAVLTGPPTRPLEKLRSRIDGGRVQVLLEVM